MQLWLALIIDFLSLTTVILFLVIATSSYNCDPLYLRIMTLYNFIYLTM